MDKRLMMERVTDAWRDCRRCDLHLTRNNTVFWRGSQNARIAIIGEAPGEQEDKRGVPFVGKAGKKLDEVLRAAGLSPESQVFICNVLACRPPGNRDPKPEERVACKRRVEAMLWIVDPEVVVFAGNAALALAGISKVSAFRGSVFRYEFPWRDEVVAFKGVATYHPSFLLRNPSDFDAAVGDFKLAWEVANE